MTPTIPQQSADLKSTKPKSAGLNRASLKSADLDDPLYYLHNFSTLVEWVQKYHANLLLEHEQELIAAIHDLPTPSRALLVRMLMRRGNLFRQSRLHYEEIRSTEQALEQLIDHGWITADPDLDVSTLGLLLTRKELREFLSSASSALPAAMSKEQMLTRLESAHEAISQPLHGWAPDLNDRVVELNCRELFSRLQLMFFGNMSQDLSAFVLSELGHHRFEAVPFTADSRAFSSREEVDLYLLLHRAQEALENNIAEEDILALLPPSAMDNLWLERRRSRILFALARSAARAGHYDRALSLYAQSSHPEANQRRFRVLELSQPNISTYWSLTEALKGCSSAGEREALERIERRLSRLLEQPSQTYLRRANLSRIDLSLPGPGAVELSVAQHLSCSEAPVYYVENTLINGLFALLCWEAIYAPLPGAFFHPFQAAPADLSSADFVRRRRALFDEALGALQQPGYKKAVLHRYREKEGITCPFINWQCFEFELVEQALECIPAEDLAIFFRRILEDIPAHRSGLPDLIQFFPNQQGLEGCKSYRLIEVKGPGDRLQDNQRRWLEYLHRHGVAVSVCYLTWESGLNECDEEGNA